MTPKEDVKKAIVKKDIRQEEFYEHFIEECKAIMVESKFISAIELLKGKWELGKRINEEELSFKRAGYGEKIVETVSADLEMSASHLWKCVQFFKKFPLKGWDLVEDKLPEGKAITWFRLCQNILPKTTGEEVKEKSIEEKQKTCVHTKVKCVSCKKELTIEEILKLSK